MSETHFDAETTIGGHRYQIMAHPVDHGMPLMFELIALVGEPLGRLAEGALKAEDFLGALQRAASGDQAGAAAAATALQTLDLAGVGRDLGQALTRVQAAPLVKRLLAHTHRDGKPLANAVFFAEAYKQNYGELLAAVWWSIRVNRFFPLPGT